MRGFHRKIYGIIYSIDFLSFIGLSTISNSAVDGNDFTGVTDMKIVFEPNESFKQITIDLLNDNNLETIEVFQVFLDPKQLCSVRAANIIIFDDDIIDGRGNGNAGNMVGNNGGNTVFVGKSYVRLT